MIERCNPEKVWEWDAFWVKQPSESNGPEESCEKISDWSQSRPEGIDRFQKGIKLLKRDLVKKNEEDSEGDKDGEDNALQR